MQAPHQIVAEFFRHLGIDEPIERIGHRWRAGMIEVMLRRSLSDGGCIVLDWRRVDRSAGSIVFGAPWQLAFLASVEASRSLPSRRRMVP